MNPIQHSRRAVAAVICAAVLGSAAPALAVSFQWDENPWPGPPGSVLSHSYTGIGNGDVVVSLTGNTGTLVTAGPAPLSPDSNVFMDPTGNNGEHSFLIRADGNFSSPGIDISVDFDEMVGGRSVVEDLRFSIYDVDRNPATSWTDFVRIQGVLADGTRVAPTSVTGVATASWSYSENAAGTAGRVRAIGSGQPESGPGSDNGTVNVFFDMAITELMLRYRNLQDQGTNQWIAISNFSFIETPEPNSFSLVGLGLVALASARRRRAAAAQRRRPRRQRE